MLTILSWWTLLFVRLFLLDDIVVSATNMSDVRDVLYGCNSGDELDIVLVRGEEETEVKVTAQ